MQLNPLTHPISFRPPTCRSVVVLLGLTLFLGACGGGGPAEGGAGERPSRGSRGGGGSGGPPGGPGVGAPAAVPVEVAAVESGRIASTLTTHGTLEAENEVDLVARIAGPIVGLQTEEGVTVRAGQLLARIDPREVQAQLEISRVKLAEAEVDFKRTTKLLESNLVSREIHENVASTLDSARAEHARNQIQVGYTEIRAPFAGLIVRRYIKEAENVGINQPLFRLSDFEPLLCNIRVPERELTRLQPGQRAGLVVEAYGTRRFEATVVRISPVVEAASGTVKVTLEADPQGLLRPGMFANVALEVEAREGALVIPKVALSLDSIGDTVFVEVDGSAQRREIEVGYREGDRIEVLAGVSAGERVVVVGQDGLADGTPVQVLGGSVVADPRATGSAVPASAPAPGPGGFGGPGGGELTAERIEMMKERMKARGLSEAEIEERIQGIREGGPRRRDRGAPLEDRPQPRRDSKGN